MGKAQAAIAQLTQWCAAHNERLTPPREAVMGIVADSKKPLTAYEVLDALGKTLENPKPPTAYRALEFLTLHGFVHRIESLNAYVACGEGHKHNGSQFMICDQCGTVEEAHLCHLPKDLQAQADQQGFKISYWNAEIHGRCKDCA